MSGAGLLPITFPVIFAAPSGAGKTTIAHELAIRRPDVEFSISATTRKPRPNERDGVDYHFRTEEEFRNMIARGELLEWAEVHGHLYGTPGSNLERARERRHFLLLDIDVQGSRQIKGVVPEAVSIFVLPPSGTELARRLIDRGSEDPVRRTRRLRAAREEIVAAVEFDYVIVNDDLSAAVHEVEGILLAECRRASRLPELQAKVDRLIHDVDLVLQS
jgi:guanylate kinase